MLNDYNHVGIYIGNDLVIEAKGVDYGVHVASFSQDIWHGYGMLDWIYPDMKDYEQDLSSSVLTETGVNGRRYSPRGTRLSGYPALGSGQGSPGISGSVGGSAGTTKVYKIGSSGREVEQIQRRLWAEAGNGNLAITGMFGSETESAATQFQRSRLIEDDGIVGGGTWRKLFPTLKRGGSGTIDDNKALQVMLNYQNFNVGTPDGIIGKGTEAAIKAYQESRDMIPPDGIVGGMSWESLCLDKPRQGADFNAGTSIYKIGSTGDKVRQIQRRLMVEPNISDITVTGTFNSTLADAVKTFQNGRGILVDGLVGNGTLFPTLKEGYGSKEDVSALQKLMDYQRYKVDQDGIFGLRLQEAVTDFQNLCSLDPDGVAGGGTWEQLCLRVPSGSVKDFTTPSNDGGVLKLGTKGQKVTQIQRRLNSLYGGTVNGYFDDSTETRVKAFQRSKGILDDGAVGSATWSKLFPLLKEGWTGKDDIRSLQILLNRSGCNCGTPDGVFGSDTTTAVVLFQNRNGMYPGDGAVGADTWAALCRS